MVWWWAGGVVEAVALARGLDRKPVRATQEEGERWVERKFCRWRGRRGAARPPGGGGSREEEEEEAGESRSGDWERNSWRGFMERETEKWS